MATTPSDANPDSTPAEAPETHPDHLTADRAEAGELDIEQERAGQREERPVETPMSDAGSPGGTAGTGGTNHEWDQ